jgi:hypothetical protein
MSRTDVIDGSLASWSEVEKRCSWDTLLLGNGLSINVWPDFAYRSLFEKAAEGTRFGHLSLADRKVFSALGGGTNFERVLACLEVAIRIAPACGYDAAPLRQRYRSIRSALGKAVRAAHVQRAAVPDSALRQIREALLAFRRVFTTSYDLIIYWAMGCDEAFEGFCDCFWSNARNEFDVNNAEIWPGITPVFFLHGALHLVVAGDGTTRKLTRDDRTLLARFGELVPGEPDTRPLLVTEGSSRDKLAAIERNDYLAFALEVLRAPAGPVVVFGHSLSRQDRHLIEALNLHPERPVAVSILPDQVRRVRARQSEIRAVLDTQALYFFDSTTHPLGAPGLRASSARDARRARQLRILAEIAPSAT